MPLIRRPAKNVSNETAERIDETVVLDGKPTQAEASLVVLMTHSRALQ